LVQSEGLLRIQVDTIQIWSCEEWSAQPLASRWLEWLVTKMRRLESRGWHCLLCVTAVARDKSVGYHVCLEFTYRCQRFSRVEIMIYQ
jgi:hypothetical protein